MNEINNLIEKLVTYHNLSDYHTKLIEALGLVANSGEFKYNENVLVPQYDDTKKEWTNISLTISEAVSQLYKLVNSLGLSEEDFDENDFLFNKSSLNPDEDDDLQK